MGGNGRELRVALVVLGVVWLGGCVPGLGPFVLSEARGRVLDRDSGEPIPGAEVLQWYRGAGRLGGPPPVYAARWSHTDADGRFEFPRQLAWSVRMWLFRTYGPTYSFFHPSYGLVHGGGAGGDVELRGSLRDSAQRLADLDPLCGGETRDAGSRRLAAVGCDRGARAHYPDGSPRVAGALDARGRRTGPWVFYRSDGSVAARGEYVAGAPTGTWEFLDRNGNVVLRR